MNMLRMAKRMVKETARYLLFISVTSIAVALMFKGINTIGKLDVTETFVALILVVLCVVSLFTASAKKLGLLK